MEVGDHIILQVSQFKDLEFIVQNDGEIEDINNQIQVWWLKWRRASSILCETKIPLKLKEKFYRTVREKILGCKEPTKEIN